MKTLNRSSRPPTNSRRKLIRRRRRKISNEVCAWCLVLGALYLELCTWSLSFELHRFLAISTQQKTKHKELSTKFKAQSSKHKAQNFTPALASVYLSRA